MKKIFLIAFLTVSVLGASNSYAAPYAKDYFGETVVHKAAFEDTLIHMARQNGLGFVELRAANPTLDPWIPGAGARIILPKKHILPDAPRKGLVINLAEMRVYYFKEEGKEPQTYPISIGREGLQTPTGSTKIVRKAEGPTWRPTARMRKEDPELPASVGPGPENPLGTHALYLGWPQYLIHGTNKPYGIGRRVSSGCMRMYPEDIKELFPQVPVGTPVTVVDQPVKVGWVDDKLYVEVSPNQDQSIKIEEDGVVKSYEITAEDMKRISKKAGEHADKINWSIVRKAVQEHRGVPVSILNSYYDPRFASNADLQELLEQTDLEQEDVVAEVVKTETQEEAVSNEVKVKKTNFNLNN
jgi:L,D-transpeptidase ErfK/SrfK